MQRVMMAALALALGGCATVEPMTTPDGGRGFVVSCDGLANSWGSCYKDAMAACSGRYDVIDRQTTSMATAYGPLVSRNLMVSCKA